MCVCVCVCVCIYLPYKQNASYRLRKNKTDKLNDSYKEIDKRRKKQEIPETKETKVSYIKKNIVMEIKVARKTKTTLL